MSIGCYPIQAALIAFNHEEPESIIATGYKGESQGKLTDRIVSITLKYSNHRLAVLNCLGEDIEPINSLNIHGTKGKVKCIFKFFHSKNFRCN
jgi:predicted dehydrogenase